MSTAQQNQPAPFAIGTSTSVAAAPSNVDMSLDDLISSRRKQTRKHAPRAASKTPSASARATGQNKARRGAVVNARRGINTANAAPKGKPSAMEVERQVYRAQRRVVGGAIRAAVGSRGGRSNNAARASGSVSRATAPRASDVQAKAKARLNAARTAIAKQKPGGVNSGAIAAPTPQAVSAAARAMKDFGFTAPKGMQMLISFVPKKTNSPAASGGNNGGRGNRNGNDGGRGRGFGRGRGGRR